MTTTFASIDEEQYPALARGAEIVKTIRFNLRGEAVTPHDLNRIHVPLGGGTIWTLTDGDGAETARKVLEGIIVHVARRRAYWSASGPSGDPPDCSSSDCLHGVGKPGGTCAACPLNVFGTARRPEGGLGRGKACKESKLLFLLRAGCVLPDVVSVPASSLKALRQFQLKLGQPYWSVLTRLTLEKARNKDGIHYATIRPSKCGVLPDDVARQVVAYAQALKSVFAAVTVRQGDVREAGTREAT